MNWGGVAAAGIGSAAADWFGGQVGAANEYSGQAASAMQEQANAAWFGGVVGASGGALSDEASKEGY